MFIAAAAERTRHIRLGTGVVSLPYHNPFILADRMVQLDHMTRGRAMFGVGPGALVHDALKIGIKAGESAAHDERVARRDRATAARRDASPRRPTGTTWRTRSCSCRATRSRSMEMAVAASRSPAGALAAGRHGIGMLSIGGTSPEAMEASRKNWGLYEEQARANGHVPDRKQVAPGDADAHRRNAREGAREREVRPRCIPRLFPDVAHVPDRAGRYRGSLHSS